MIKPLKSPAILLAIAVGLLCVILQLADLAPVLRYDQSAISQGQFWLLLTGNFVHLGSGHLLLNLAGFVLIILLLWVNYSALEWLILILLCSLGVGGGLYLFDPDVFWYVGFSGTLHGLLLAGAIADTRRYPRQAVALIVIVIAKLVAEQLTGPMPGSEKAAGGAVVVNSHLYGALAGAVIGVLLLLTSRRQKHRQ